MKLYIQQKIFSWTDKFYVKNESGENVYLVEGELLSWGKRLHIFNSESKEVAFLKQKVWSWMPKYELFIEEEKEAEMNRKFSFFKPHYTVTGPDWEITGDFWAHNYVISENGEAVVTISKKWLSWGDTYELDIKDPKNEILALSVVLAIDADLQAAAQASSD
jgi:uncharacterized protein YxjI